MRILPQDHSFDITLFVDGGSRGNPGPAAIGAVILREGKEAGRVSEFIGKATNNEAEYRALIAGLKAATGMRAMNIHVKSDSELMVKQLLKQYKVKSANIKPLYEEAVLLLRDYAKVSIERVPRERNKAADKLVNEALDTHEGKKEKNVRKDKAAIIGFLSDFGLEDAWAGVVKGVVKSYNPAAEVIDISHEVPPYDIRKGAFVLETAVEHMPASVFLAVVDPDVGGKRRAIILRATSDALLVGPDNGLLMPAAGRLGGVAEAFVITGGLKLPRVVSATFHARDVFAPVAAQLAAGKEPSELATEIDRATLIKGPYSRADLKPGVIRAEVIDIDRFGTLRLNARRADAEIAGFTIGTSAFLSVEDDRLKLPIVETFSSVTPGKAMLLYDSSDYLCVAVSGAHAATMFGLKAGDWLSLKSTDR